jgi:hypothetical protein
MAVNRLVLYLASGEARRSRRPLCPDCVRQSGRTGPKFIKVQRNRAATASTWRAVQTATQGMIHCGLGTFWRSCVRTRSQQVHGSQRCSKARKGCNRMHTARPQRAANQLHPVHQMHSFSSESLLRHCVTAASCKCQPAAACPTIRRMHERHEVDTFLQGPRFANSVSAKRGFV